MSEKDNKDKSAFTSCCGPDFDFTAMKKEMKKFMESDEGSFDCGKMMEKMKSFSGEGKGGCNCGGMMQSMMQKFNEKSEESGKE